jgi:hypothetical protein
MITVTDKSETLLAGIGKMIDAMVVDYSKGNTNERMFNEYKDGFKTIVGQKFIKITNGNGVKAFIVKEDNGKFKMGDILKPASWRAPAKNSARGNVLEGGYAIQWTGPLYLR